METYDPSPRHTTYPYTHSAKTCPRHPIMMLNDLLYTYLPLHGCTYRLSYLLEVLAQ